MFAEWLLDFDQTVAKTFTPPPNGYGVAQACEVAVRALFGPAGLVKYHAQGGLMNRTPAEVVQSLDPELVPDRVLSYAELFIQIKKDCMMSQIGFQSDGSAWPALFDGFADFWAALKRCGSLVQTGIISSGHTDFIEKVWQTHGLEPPDVIVSDDDLRNLARPAELARRVKPAPLPLLMARRSLAGNCIDWPSWRSKDRVIYFGDDPSKDGIMARRAQVAFGHFDPHGTNGQTSWGYQIASWKWARKHLL